MSDAHQIKKISKSSNQKGLKKQFELIYNKYCHLVGFIIGNYIKDIDDIKDLTNDTFLYFFNHIENINSSIKNYLTTCAKNAAINFLKKTKNIVQADNCFDYLASETKDNSIYYDIDIILDDFEKKIFYLHLIYDYTFKEISIQLNKPVSTIKTTYFRSIKKIKSKLL